MIKSDLAAQQASSANGRRARVHAFREVRWWRRAVRRFKAAGLTSPVGPISAT
jgi:hypothetical protein